MKPILHLQNIELPQIDFDNLSYAISPEQDTLSDKMLSISIARYGILHPPILRETAPGLYSIVAGRKRLLALFSLHNEKTCACRVISRQVPEVDVFDILLEAIQFSRELTIIEKAIFLQKITAITDEKKVIREFLPRLGLAPNAFSIKQSLKLLNLEEPILRSIHNGRINESVAQGFLLLPSQDRMVLFEIIESLKLSSSYQKKLLRICSELASRGNRSITALLDNAEVHAILQHQDANPPQKTKNLMLWLSSRHRPRSTQAEEEFARFIAALQLPRNVSVQHTPFFEDDSITLSITFGNRKSFHRAWEKIRHATHSTDN